MNSLSVLKDIAEMAMIAAESALLTPNPELRKAIEAEVQAGSSLCWTCRSCLSECPLNVSASRMNPMKIVRLANLGLLDELLLLPEVWYCLTCNRCNAICPMRVKPAAIVLYCRTQISRRGLIPYRKILQLGELLGRFQRARWQVAFRCRNGPIPQITAGKWQRWLARAPRISSEKIDFRSETNYAEDFRQLASAYRTFNCLTCAACSSACPITFERSVFDPVWIFRMITLGLVEELIRSPSIWLCLQCQRCTDACGQMVRGHEVILELQRLAVTHAVVDRYYPKRWHAAQGQLYAFLSKAIDELFDFRSDPAPAQ